MRETPSDGRGKPRPCATCEPTGRPTLDRAAAHAYAMQRIVERWAPA